LRRRYAQRERPRKLTPPRPPSACAEDAGGDAAPGAAQAVQRPDAEHVVDLPAVLGQVNITTNRAAGDAPDDQRTERVHQVGAGADGDQAGERAVMHEARVVLADDRAASVPPTIAISELTATRPLILSSVCALMTLKPNQPTVRIQAPSARKGMLEGGCARCAPSFVAAAPRAEQQHRRQRDPAAHRMHHHRAGEVVEFAPKLAFKPGLDAVIAVPGDALEERIDEADQQRWRQLRQNGRARRCRRK
jgi:hypothetical protein